jgi:hypothetical protein
VWIELCWCLCCNLKWRPFHQMVLLTTNRPFRIELGLERIWKPQNVLLCVHNIEKRHCAPGGEGPSLPQWRSALQPHEPRCGAAIDVKAHFACWSPTINLARCCVSISRPRQRDAASRSMNLITLVFRRSTWALTLCWGPIITCCEIGDVAIGAIKQVGGSTTARCGVSYMKTPSCQ